MNNTATLLNPSKVAGFKSSYYDTATDDEYWISGCTKRGGDTLHGGVVETDPDARDEYWVTIRRQPGRRTDRTTGSPP